MKPTHIRSHRQVSGATLVEVVITVGMLVSMLLPLVGMLSIAVKDSGKAINLSISSRISSQLIGEVQQASWTTLPQWDGRNLYFNDQGVQLVSAALHSQASYMARVRIDDTAVTNSTSPAPANDHQMRVLVAVTSFGGLIGKTKLDDTDKALQESTALPKDVQLSRTVLVNMQKDL